VRAVDTNVVVRFLTGDDAEQFKHARRAMESGTVFIPKTVLLETEWVLRRAYSIAPRQILDAMESLLRAAEIVIEDESAIEQALLWYRDGMDLADALHIASRGAATQFLTFDKRLTSAARKAGIKGVIQP
jgi:predicted nucleic-acid-binding protein